MFDMRNTKEYIKDSIKIIITIMITIFVLGICSCSAKRELSCSSYAKDSTLSTILHEVESVKAESYKGSYTKIVFYDTSLPLDECTGKPPEKIVIEKRDSIYSIAEIHDTINVEIHDSIFVREGNYSNAIVEPNKKEVVILFVLFLIVIVLFLVRLIRDKYE